MVGDDGPEPGSLRFRQQPKLAQPRFRSWGGLPVSTPEGWGPPPGSGDWLPLWDIRTWTWEDRVCTGSVSECTTSIVVCLGCVGVSVFMCTHDSGNV
ncbi:hypothetical protein AMECASPLE_012198 [Ameca splendens]|uniref:Uncharacterized protein n=1 Tax=Ameca splendens TaxID=208324 RepID=A0ABV0XE27_9TELE